MGVRLIAVFCGGFSGTLVTAPVTELDVFDDELVEGRFVDDVRGL